MFVCKDVCPSFLYEINENFNYVAPSNNGINASVATVSTNDSRNLLPDRTVYISSRYL
jgi:hypothetical protein